MTEVKDTTLRAVASPKTQSTGSSGSVTAPKDTVTTDCQCIFHTKTPQVNKASSGGETKVVCVRCGNSVDGHPKMCCALAFQKGWDPKNKDKSWQFENGFYHLSADAFYQLSDFKMTNSVAPSETKESVASTMHTMTDSMGGSKGGVAPLAGSKGGAAPLVPLVGGSKGGVAPLVLVETSFIEAYILEDQKLTVSHLNLSCGVCRLLTPESVTTSCGETFCKTCWRVLSTSLAVECPVCHSVGIKIVADKLIERTIANIRVRCPYPECSWQGERSAWLKHLKTVCAHVPETCKLCQALLSRGQMTRHTKEECLERSTLCEDCCETMPFRLIKDHRDNKCVFRMVDCENKCGEQLEFHALDHHLKRTCVLAVLRAPCCSFQGTCEQVAKHLMDHQSSLSHTQLWVQEWRRQEERMSLLEQRLSGLEKLRAETDRGTTRPLGESVRADASGTIVGAPDFPRVAAGQVMPVNANDMKGLDRLIQAGYVLKSLAYRSTHAPDPVFKLEWQLFAQLWKPLTVFLACDRESVWEPATCLNLESHDSKTITVRTRFVNFTPKDDETIPLNRHRLKLLDGAAFGRPEERVTLGIWSNWIHGLKTGDLVDIVATKSTPMSTWKEGKIVQVEGQTMFVAMEKTVHSCDMRKLLTFILPRGCITSLTPTATGSRSRDYALIIRED